MKFRLISSSGDALALLYRIANEGHSCDFFIKKKNAQDSYKGILTRIDSPTSKLTKDTICIFDMVGQGALADQIKKSGFKVYGAGRLNDTMELKRDFGMKLANLCGIKMPKWERFSSFDKAIDFVNKSEKLWVFKPQDNKSPAFTYVPDDQEDLAEMLEYFSKTWTAKIDFVLQEKIEGVEISTEAWYVNGELVPNSINSTLETKRFLDGDYGPNTGCTSSTVWFWPEKAPNKWAKRTEPTTATIYRLTLKMMESFLKRYKYNGPLDINTIISEKDKLPYFLEYTARTGYSALYALCEGLNMEIGQFFSELASGEIPELKPSYDYLGAVRVSIPPYPNDDGVAKSANKPIRINSLDHIWLLDAKYEDDKLVTAGVDGVVAEVTGKAKTLDELEKDIYKRIEKIKVPDMQFRTDVFRLAKKKISKLKDWHYF